MHAHEIATRRRRQGQPTPPIPRDRHARIAGSQSPRAGRLRARDPTPPSRSRRLAQSFRSGPARGGEEFNFPDKICEFTGAYNPRESFSISDKGDVGAPARVSRCGRRRAGTPGRLCSGNRMLSRRYDLTDFGAAWGARVGRSGAEGPMRMVAGAAAFDRDIAGLPGFAASWSPGLGNPLGRTGYPPAGAK